MRGIIFGEMLDCTSPGAAPELLDEVILRVFENFDGPIAIGLRSGHVSRANVTLTFGVEAELHAAIKRNSICWSRRWKSSSWTPARDLDGAPREDSPCPHLHLANNSITLADSR